MMKICKEVDAKHYTIPFKELIENHPVLNSLLISVSPPKFNLGDPLTLSQVNKCLYKEMLNLEISVPDNYLIPSLGIRYAYCDVINSLIQTNKPVIEVGTGASAAIAMILAKKYKKRILATEINENSVNSAKRNIETNQLGNSIKLIKSNGEVLQNLIPNGKYSGLFCYPPIYSNDQTILAKKRGWKGTETELIGGGKKGMNFSLQLLREALENEEIRIDVVSLMILNKNQLNIIKRKLLKDREYHFVQINAGTRKRFVLVIDNT